MKIPVKRKVKNRPNGGLSKQDAETLRRLRAKQKARVRTCTLILAVAWIASFYLTFLGLMLTAEETVTANFKGTILAVIASIVSGVVVAGACALLLGFSGEVDGDE